MTVHNMAPECTVHKQNQNHIYQIMYVFENAMTLKYENTLNKIWRNAVPVHWTTQNLHKHLSRKYKFENSIANIILYVWLAAFWCLFEQNCLDFSIFHVSLIGFLLFVVQCIPSVIGYTLCSFIFQCAHSKITIKMPRWYLWLLIYILSLFFMQYRTPFLLTLSVDSYSIILLQFISSLIVHIVYTSYIRTFVHWQTTIVSSFAQWLHTRLTQNEFSFKTKGKGPSSFITSKNAIRHTNNGCYSVNDFNQLTVWMNIWNSFAATHSLISENWTIRKSLIDNRALHN